VARLLEGHVDAVAILAELGGAPAGGLLAVWAARPADVAAARTRGGWRLTGTKPFCSGAGSVDAALITAIAPDGPRLFVVEASAVEVVPHTWSPLGMEATRSSTIRIEIEVPDAAAVGGAGGYVDRPGFGHGGCGVAACWWGGTLGVLRDLHGCIDAADPLALADLGRATSQLDLARLTLRDAAAQIDAAPRDQGLADRVALATRFACAEAGRAVVAAAERHRGTSSLAVDGASNARLRDLVTYLSQHRDGAAVDLGRAAGTRLIGLR